MGKKQKKVTQQQSFKSKKEEAPATSGASLKDLLSADTLAKLKEQGEAAKQAEQARKDAEAVRKAEAERAERKRLENDFNYLLEQSDPNWSKYK